MINHPMKSSTDWPVYISTIFIFLFSASANANNLEVEPSASWIFHLGAAILLYAHIGGGAVGILSGVVASLSRKGSYIHRMAGRTFLISMFVCYLIGAVVAPFLESQQSTNFVAAILALYLLITGVIAARRKHFTAGLAEKIGLLVAVSITAMGVTFMAMALQSPNGSVDGSPPQAYVLFIIAGGLAAIGELNVILRKELSSTARIARHLWRMCMSFFIASGSLFFGQVQFFPDWFNQSILQLVLGFFPLVILIIYLLKIVVKKIRLT